MNFNIIAERWQRSKKAEAKVKFEALVEDHKNAFLSHPITQAMLNGGDGGLLSAQGDLNSFLGVTEKQAREDIDEILKYYDTASKLKFTKLPKKTKSNLEFEIPDKNEIFAMTPLPWAEGRSWTKGIEQGVAGFGYFLETGKTAKYSRTGKGIQIKTKIRSGNAGRTQYISALLNDFRKEARQLLRKI